MTLAYLIELACFGSALDDNSSWEDYEDIHDFAKTWRALAYVKLDDIILSRKEEQK